MPNKFGVFYDRDDSKESGEGSTKDDQNEAINSEIDPYMTFNQWTDKFKTVVKVKSPQKRVSILPK